MIFFLLSKRVCSGPVSGYDRDLLEQEGSAVPQLIALAVAGTLAYAGYKWLSKQNERAASKAKARSEQPQTPRNLGSLEWDEAAGVYRPRRND